ncbi:unnamed protein product, partial [Cylicocyclus nassatus]
MRILNLTFLLLTILVILSAVDVGECGRKSHRKVRKGIKKGIKKASKNVKKIPKVRNVRKIKDGTDDVGKIENGIEAI